MLLKHEMDQMCCLGQVCFQLGVPLEDLRDRALPVWWMDEAGKGNGKLEAAGLVEGRSLGCAGWALACARQNDDLTINDEVREREIGAQFKLVGHELEFRDEVAPWFAGERA